MTPAIERARNEGGVFKVHHYEHNPRTDSFGDDAVKALRLKPTQVFKTLVVETHSGQLVVAVVPVSSKLDLKAIASVVNTKKAFMAEKAKVQQTTGYVLGGVSPIGQRKPLMTFIDISAHNFDTIFVSGGKRGLEIELDAADLAKLTQASFASIAIV